MAQSSAISPATNATPFEEQVGLYMATEQNTSDFGQASEITMQTYGQIASNYAERHQYKTLPQLWQEHHQIFTAQSQASPLWQANCSRPRRDAGCGTVRHPLSFAT